MANNPVAVQVAAKSWEKVAASVEECNIVALNTAHKYTVTYRTLSGPSIDPSDADIPLNPTMDGREAKFGADELCDVWLYNPSNETVSIYVAAQ